jgi:hypothetical protein
VQSQQESEQRWNEPLTHSSYGGQASSQGGNGGSSSGGVVVGSVQHQNLWEQGQIDYTGRDSFHNIQAHLDAQLPKPQ